MTTATKTTATKTTATKISEQTQSYTFNHTMLRIKDPKPSLDFYQNVLGMTLLYKKSYPDAKFDLYFLAKLSDNEIANLPAQDTAERAEFTFSQRGVLELTHNYDTQNDADFAYHHGNSEPKGFGHICFAVPDLMAAVAWFDENNVVFQKRPEEGMMKNIAFIKDPDGYWIEIVQANTMR
ncbi:lactoylglutathione lyase [Moraxella macacae 0408225]|uniref:Lactoylglutathione lyase n=1 Tax=Moraxella macacae 0408225 TaxID=1230338 RepID=L2F8C4_9GAMM|nr:lactoylglutathione lyase [Moraxella macacae]ELA08713.1 lactoylglutathione lyase [Moraxella macacae 0408225]